MKNTVDVVVPTFNSRTTIARCVQSIMAQIDVTVRIIVVDNCSTDGTVELVQGMVREIDFILSEPDDGVYSAMNKALEQVNSEFVCFLNSDDWFQEPMALTDLCFCARSNAADIVVSDVIMNYRFVARKISSRYGLNKIWRWLGLSPPHQGQLWRRRFLKSNQLVFDESFKNAADFLFFWKARLCSDKIARFRNYPTVQMSAGGLSTRPGSYRVNSRELVRALRILTRAPYIICWLGVRGRIALKLLDCLPSIIQKVLYRITRRE